MLFNSLPFIFYFLPIVLLMALISVHVFKSTKLRNSILCFSSLFFYGYWNIGFLPLLIGSITLNYFGSLLIERHIAPKFIVLLMVIANIACLVCFKYLLFFASIFIANEHIPEFIRTIVLPIGISFFTFQQVAYIIDIYKRKIVRGSFLNYVLFVSFFPQLIAGPIVKYQHMKKQLSTLTPLHTHFRQGAFLFIVGLFKKVVIADSFALQANQIFLRTENAGNVGAVDAWFAAWSYSFQLYFDFSAYSDMAIGLGLMLGFILPVNFNSPYKARSVIDFWRRWHISLSNFFRDYVYIPMGGNHHGFVRQMLLLMFVMLLVGFWHGAGWTFITWGLYHGLLLVIAHTYKKHFVIPERLNRFLVKDFTYVRKLRPFFCMAVTFNLIAVGWIIFRAPNMDIAWIFLEALAGEGRNSSSFLLQPSRYALTATLLIIGGIICFLLPNAIQLANIGHEADSLFHDKAIKMDDVERPKWLNLDKKMSAIFIVLLAALFYVACTSMLEAPVEFIYFQF